MEEKSDTLLTLNSFTLLISLTLLVGILAILLITFSTGLGMLFGMLLALVYPVLLLLALCGFGLYVVLLVLNIKATVRWIRKKTSARRPKLTLLVFSGSTVILIAVVSGLISAPLIIIEARQFSVSNPFLTRPVRIVPVYPIGRMDDQSKFDEIGQTFFRSYNVANRHADDIVSWYQDVFAQPPWTLVETNRYEENDPIIGEMVYYCIVVKRNEDDNQMRTYYVEIFGKDVESNHEIHINIGTPNPITDVCGRFLDSP